jgi:exopolysaccharide production protein ExoZ
LALALGLRLALGGPVLDFVGNPIILEFLAGVAVARAPASRPAGAAALLAGVAMICAIAALRDAVEGWDRAPVMTLPCSLVIYGASQFTGSGPVWRGMALLGDASYSAYLVHQFPLSIAKAGRGLLPALPETAVLILLCWGVALVVYRGVEQPLLQRLRRPSAAPAAAATRA